MKNREPVSALSALQGLRRLLTVKKLTLVQRLEAQQLAKLAHEAAMRDVEERVDLLALVREMAEGDRDTAVAQATALLEKVRAEIRP